MPNSLLKFSDVANKNATPATLRAAQLDVLTADDDACATEIEPYLTPPGVKGSREWDHCEAMNILLKHDALHGGRIASIMVSSNLSHRMLWQPLVDVYRKAGFKMSHGRLIGVLEDKSDDSNGNDTDGIE